MKLYNSLTRQKEVFHPIDADHIRMYACGPTVYSYAHIGNARQSVVFDMVRRVMSAFYPRVTYVANITDIDDKIIAAAQKTGEPISAITEKYTAIYNADMAALGVQKPTMQPKATEHVAEMIAMIATLIEKGHAYAKDGHALFHVPSYDDYGCLSGRDREEQIAGARVEVAPYKKDAADFVLWKPSTDDQPGWDSPWGRGRPGWHIECSVMAREYLGDVFDIHGGGLDLTFPHHENEIAQSCCATGKDHFANVWMHNGFVTVEGEKMSKSIGNVILPHDLIDQGIAGEAIRLALLSTHYRQPFDWTQDGVTQATKTLDKWYDAVADIPPADTPDPDFMAALADDLNTPLAISILHRLAKDNPAQLKACANILGFLEQTTSAWATTRQSNRAPLDEDIVNTLIEKRNTARAAKDFATSDAIRDELAAMGVTIKDGPDGTTWQIS